MKKKGLILNAILVMFLLSGCCTSHEWEEATCTIPKTCVKCEKTEGEPLGHEWQEATCIDLKTCAVCWETEGELKEHEWQEATCEFPKYCDYCGEVSGVVLEHEWKTDNTVVKECINCGNFNIPDEATRVLLGELENGSEKLPASYESDRFIIPTTIVIKVYGMKGGATPNVICRFYLDPFSSLIGKYENLEYYSTNATRITRTGGIMYSDTDYDGFLYVVNSNNPVNADKVVITLNEYECTYGADELEWEDFGNRLLAYDKQNSEFIDLTDYIDEYAAVMDSRESQITEQLEEEEDVEETEEEPIEENQEVVEEVHYHIWSKADAKCECGISVFDTWYWDTSPYIVIDNIYFDNSDAAGAVIAIDFTFLGVSQDRQYPHDYFIFRLTDETTNNSFGHVTYEPVDFDPYAEGSYTVKLGYTTYSVLRTITMLEALYY